MQSNITLSGRTVAVGLNWSAISAAAASGRKKEIKKICAETGLKFGVLISRPDVAAIGLCAKKVDTPSAAALLAESNAMALKDRAFGDSSSNSSWILVEKVKSLDKRDMFWMCAITQGVPVPGTDVIEDLSVICAKLAEYIEILESVDIFSPDAEIQEYVTTGNFVAIDKNFNDLVADVSLPKGGKPQKIDGIPDVVIYSLIGLVSLSVAAVGFMYFNERAQREEAKRALVQKQQSIAMEQQQREAAVNQQYQVAVSSTKDRLIGNVKTSLSYSPAIMVSAWAKTILDLELDSGGWDVQRAVCSVKECEIFFKRNQDYGTNDSLFEALPDAQLVQNGEAKIVRKVDVTLRNVSLDALRNWATFERYGISDLQRIKNVEIDSSLSAKSDLTFQPPPLPSAQPGQAPRTAPTQSLGLARGTISLGGSGLWKVSDLASIIDIPEIALEKFEVNFGRSLSSDATWRVIGSYYLRSDVGVGVPVAQPGPQNTAVQGQISPNAVSSGVVAPTVQNPQPPTNRPLVQK